MKFSFRSIAFRVAAAATTAALAILVGAGAVVWSFQLADRQIEGALAAQHRLDLLSAVSAQVADYALVALDSAGRLNPGNQDLRLVESRRNVMAAFTAVETALAMAVENAGSETQKTFTANKARLVARLKAGFEVLDQQIGARFADPKGATADEIRGALNGFGATFGPTLSSTMDDERRTAGRIQDEMRALGRTMTMAAVAAVGIALVFAALFYRALARPLLTRIAAIGETAAALGRGEWQARVGISGRDELSLAMATFNRMAARLQRREDRVAADRARLEQTVAERTADLREANQRLADVDAARRRFFTDVSHELRTPLTVVLGECDLALRREMAEPTREALCTIRVRTQRLHRKVEDLLRVARSESGEIDIELEPVEVERLIADTVEDTGALARRAGLRLETAVDTDGLTALADPDWMRQVLEGLVANAVRHSPAGGRIALKAFADGDDAVLMVEDEGSGIAAADLPHLFERFYRGAGATGGSGFGIGLALAKWVVERHDGSIAIASRLEADPAGPRGTTVTIRLPALERTDHTL